MSNVLPGTRINRPLLEEARALLTAVETWEEHNQAAARYQVQRAMALALIVIAESLQRMTK